MGQGSDPGPCQTHALSLRYSSSLKAHIFEAFFPRKDRSPYVFMVLPSPCQQGSDLSCSSSQVAFRSLRSHLTAPHCDVQPGHVVFSMALIMTSHCCLTSFLTQVSVRSTNVRRGGDSVPLLCFQACCSESHAVLVTLECRILYFPYS